jgi:hypothetical protein
MLFILNALFDDAAMERAMMMAFILFKMLDGQDDVYIYL